MYYNWFRILMMLNILTQIYFSKDINGIKNDEILKTCIDVFDNLDNFVFTNPFESVKNNSNLIS
jgi:hypothetical protein